MSQDVLNKGGTLAWLVAQARWIMVHGKSENHMDDAFGGSPMA